MHYSDLLALDFKLSLYVCMLYCTEERTPSPVGMGITREGSKEQGHDLTHVRMVNAFVSNHD